MAARSTNGTGGGAWSSTATWSGGVVPVSGDTVTIVLGDTVTFDVDQSGFAAGLAGLTINGTINVSTSAGTYVLKMDGVSGHNITFGSSGQLNAGSVGTPLPANVYFGIDIKGSSATAASLIACNTGTIVLSAQQPTHRWAKLTVQAAVAATSITIDTDLSADAPWLDTSVPGGLRIAIVRVRASGTRDVEIRTVTSITSTTINFSGGGLATIKEVGSYVVLLSRNVRVFGQNGSVVGLSNLGSTSRIYCQVEGGSATTGGNYLISGSSSLAVVDGVVHSNNYQFNGSCQFSGVAVDGGASGPGGFTIGCVMSGASFGNAVGVSSMSNAKWSGLIAGCVSGIAGCNGGYLTGQMYGGSIAIQGGDFYATSACTIDSFINAFEYSSGVFCGTISNCSIMCGSFASIQSTIVFQGATFSNTTDFAITAGNLYKLLCYGCATTSTNFCTGYGFAEPDTKMGPIIVESFDHNATSGAYRAYMPAGFIQNDATTLTGYDRSFKMNFERVSSFLYRDVLIWGHKNQAITVSVTLKQNTTGLTSLPTAQIIDPNLPFMDASAILAHTDLPTDNTSEQTFTVSYTPAYDRPLVFRLRAMNASNSLLFNFTVSNGSSGVSQHSYTF